MLHSRARSQPWKGWPRGEILRRPNRPYSPGVNARSQILASDKEGHSIALASSASNRLSICLSASKI
jgi:hypothetical protein